MHVLYVVKTLIIYFIESLFFKKKCVQLMTFSDFISSSNECFKNLELLKLPDLIKLNNILLTHKILNKNCPPTLVSVFSLSFLNHDHETRESLNHLLFKPSFRTHKYGTLSIYHLSPKSYKIYSWTNILPSLPHYEQFFLKKF